MNKLNILIACEFSGICRDAFIKKGHNAISCDLLQTECAGPHLQCDVLSILDNDWDMMIGFPPCTHLASSGAKWFAKKRADGRQQEAIKFFMALANAPIERIAIENPVGIMSREYRKPDQMIQPWQYGHPESKKTCLWLKNLPLLKPTNILDKPKKGYWENQTPSGQNKLGPSENRWKLRSITYQGFADAMANQWG